MITLEKIQSDVEGTLKVLYKSWPDIKRFLKSFGCPATDAEDIFQEALLIFIRKLDNPSFDLTVEPYHFVKKTCKLLWFNQSRKDGKIKRTEFHEDIEEQEDEWFQKEMKLLSIEKAIAEIGDQCQQLLKLFYGFGQSMEEIAKRLGLRNDNVAKSQKYRCLSKVKDILRSQESHSI